MECIWGFSMNILTKDKKKKKKKNYKKKGKWCKSDQEAKAQKPYFRCFQNVVPQIVLMASFLPIHYTL